MVIFRIIYKLIARGWLLLYFPLSIASKHLFTIGLVLIIGYIFISLFSGDPDDVYRNPVEAAHQPMPSTDGNVLIQPVEYKEDGNSAFASDLLDAMNKNELLYYSQLFYWVMTHQPDGTPYSWNNQNINGTLTPSGRFQNKLGATCRRFNETLKVRNTEQKLSGIACEKYAGSWCKLRNNSTPACNLGRKPGFASWWGDLKRKIGRIF